MAVPKDLVVDKPPMDESRMPDEGVSRKNRSPDERVSGEGRTPHSGSREGSTPHGRSSEGTTMSKPATTMKGATTVKAATTMKTAAAKLRLRRRYYQCGAQYARRYDRDQFLVDHLRCSCGELHRSQRHQ